MKMSEQTCQCGKKYMVRCSDIKRGWGKSCAAMRRTSREALGKFQIAAASTKYSKRLDSRQVDDFDPSWDAHKSHG